MIKVSEIAAEKIIEKLSEHLPRKENDREDGTNLPTLRVGIIPEDMIEQYVGFKYLFCEDGAVEGDMRYDFQGFSILVHRDHMEEVNGLQIDWRVDGLHERFDFTNPSVEGVCTCGIVHSHDNVKMLNIEKPEPVDFEKIFGKVENEDIVSESEGS